MEEKDFEKRICQQHSYQIIAVDLKLAKTQNEKYLCGKCLILRIEGQQILLLSEMIEMIKQMKNDQKKQIIENNQTQLNYMKQLQQSLKDCNQHLQEKFEKTHNNIELQIKDNNTDINKKEEIHEEVDLDKNIETLSICYKGNKEYELPQGEKNINTISQLIENVQNQIGSISNAYQYQKILESLQNIKIQFQIELSSDKDIKICEKHGLEIIMVNIEQTQEEPNRIACSKCIQELPQQYTTLEDADENWTKFKFNSKQMILKYSKDRESKFKQVIEFITNLRDKYSETLTTIINDLENNRVVTEKQLSPFPLYQKNIYQLDQNQLKDILEALSQKDLYRNLKLKLAQQDQLDSIFYHKLKETLENLVKYDFLTKEQIIMIEKNYKNFLILNEVEKEQISNTNDIKQFLENTSLLQSYMTIFEDSIELYQNLQKQVDSLNQKGDLSKLLNQQQQKPRKKGNKNDQDQQSDLVQVFQRQYSLFQQISKKYKELLIVYKDENLLTKLQQEKQELQEKLKQELTVQTQLKENRDQLENKIKNLQSELEKQKQQLEKTITNLDQKTESEKQLLIKLEQESQKLEELKTKSYEQDQKNNSQIDVLNKTITDLNLQIKNNQTTLQSKDQQITSLQQQLQNSQNSQNKLQQTHNDLLKDIKPKPNVLSEAYYQKVLQTIEEKSKQVIKCSILVYCGSKDGLNHTQFWNKVYGRRNLLMAFKSNTNYICGAFSPCQWLQHLGNYVADETLQSFLFSQNHSQIYPLKAANKAYAIYCNSSYGPTFGNHDLYIHANFNSLSCNLGSSYQCDQYGSIPASTHLFSQSSVQIIECEIFEIVFK